MMPRSACLGPYYSLTEALVALFSQYSFQKSGFRSPLESASIGVVHRLAGTFLMASGAKVGTIGTLSVGVDCDRWV